MISVWSVLFSRIYVGWSCYQTTSRAVGAVLREGVQLVDASVRLHEANSPA